MALYHFSIDQIRRIEGQSAVAAAAYRAGERLYSYYYGEVSDYTKKGGVICSEIFLPPNAPKKFLDRATPLERRGADRKASPGPTVLQLRCGAAK